MKNVQCNCHITSQLSCSCDLKQLPWHSLTLKQYTQFIEVVHVVSSCNLLNEMGDQKQTLHSQQSHVCFLNMLLQMSSVSGQCRLKKANSHYAKTRTEDK